MAIAAVVVDIGGVLERVDDGAWPEVWIRRWEGRMHLADGHVAAVLARDQPPGDFVTGGLTESQIREMYTRAMGLDDDLADQMMAEMWDAYCGELDTAMRDFVAGLRPGIATAILSNSGDGARREEQRRYGFEQLVDVIIYSHEVGLAKPDPAVFSLTEQLLGVTADEIVFVDDNQGHVEAARACGWHAVLHRDTATSISEITRLINGGR
jgi:HAD superfamily hydrolase (TIGR01509 family)